MRVLCSLVFALLAFPLCQITAGRPAQEPAPEDEARPLEAIVLADLESLKLESFGLEGNEQGRLEFGSASAEELRAFVERIEEKNPSVAVRRFDMQRSGDDRWTGFVQLRRDSEPLRLHSLDPTPVLAQLAEARGDVELLGVSLSLSLMPAQRATVSTRRRSPSPSARHSMALFTAARFAVLGFRESVAVTEAIRERLPGSSVTLNKLEMGEDGPLLTVAISTPFPE